MVLKVLCTCYKKNRYVTTGCLPVFLHDLVIIPAPDPNKELKSTSIWDNHPHLQVMQLRIPTSIELLREVVQFANRVLPRFRLYDHNMVLRTLADAIFQLQLVCDYVRLLPLPRVPQTTDDIQPGTPGTPLWMRDGL